MRTIDAWVDSVGYDGTVTFRCHEGMRLVVSLSMVRKRDRPFLGKRIQLGGGWTRPAYAFECNIDDAGFVAAVSKRIPIGAVFHRKTRIGSTRPVNISARKWASRPIRMSKMSEIERNLLPLLFKMETFYPGPPDFDLGLYGDEVRVSCYAPRWEFVITKAELNGKRPAAEIMRERIIENMKPSEPLYDV